MLFLYYYIQVKHLATKCQRFGGEDVLCRTITVQNGLSPLSLVKKKTRYEVTLQYKSFVDIYFLLFMGGVYHRPRLLPVQNIYNFSLFIMALKSFLADDDVWFCC